MIFRPAKLRQGSGNGDPADGLCLMQMVDWFAGQESVSDHPACASPALCAVGIQLNDMATDTQRQMLWPLVWQLLDSRDPAAEQLRAEYIVREVVHRLVAPAFAKIDLPRHAEALRAAHTMQEIEVAARAAEAAAMAALAAARAAARAAEAAGVVWAAALAQWRAARAAVRAARAAWAVWHELRAIFTEAIALGRHGEADPVYESRAMELQRILQSAE